MVKSVFRLGLVLGVSLMVSPMGTVYAQSLSESEIVSKLAKKKPLTRSIVPSAGSKGLSSEDAAFIARFQTRGIKIKVAEKKKLDDIIASNDLPKIDFEINFEFDSARIKENSIPDLLELGKALSNPGLSGVKVLLIGHTDAKGANEYNQDLSERRARSVASFLTDVSHIAGERLVPIGYGEDRLKNSQDGEAPENRRVEVVNVTQG